MSRRLLVSGIIVVIGIPRLAAQEPPPEAPAVRWWEGAAVVGGIAAVSLLDQPLHRYILAHRSPEADAVAADVRHMGQVEVFGSVPAGMALVGLVTQRPTLLRGSLRVATSLALAATVATAGKETLGRLRPSAERDADDFKPFSGQASFPSGHTTMAFALATSLANEIHRPWATVGLLTVAAGTGWSRLNDNQHWLSDVVAGAAIGISSAQLVDARWRIFHVRPPSVLLGSSGPVVGWRIAIR